MSSSYPSDEDREREQSRGSRASGKRQKPAAEIFRDAVATYDYLDENGKLLYQVARDAEKNFAQRRPRVGRDPGESEWIYETKDVRRVLYALPEVKFAIACGHRVYVPEGEKDASNLLKLGLTATTAAMGAKAPWLPCYSDQLAGCREVVVIPDNDGPGREHAEKVAAALVGRVGTLRILKLPVTKEGGDVSDWLAAGGNRDQLEALAAQAPLFSNPLNRYADVEVGGRDLLDRRIDSPESIIGDGILTRPSLGFLVAAAGRGKSQLLVQLAVARALGTEWLGLKVKPGRTALLLLELSAYWWQQRIRVAAGEQHAAEALNAIRIVCRPDLKGLVDISTDEELAALARWIAQCEADLLCLDPLSRTHALDENAFTVMGPLLQRIELFGFDTNTTSLISHHERKSHASLKDSDLDVASGSRVISGNATCYMRLVETGRNGPLVLRFSKTSTSGHVSDIWLRREESGLLVPTDPPETTRDKNREKVHEALLAGIPIGLTSEEVQAKTGLGRSAVSKHMIALGAVKVGKKPPRYLPPTTPSTRTDVEAENPFNVCDLGEEDSQLPFPRPEHLPPSTPSALKGGKADGRKVG